MEKQEKLKQVEFIGRRIYDLGALLGAESTLGVELDHREILEVKECFKKLIALVAE